MSRPGRLLISLVTFATAIACAKVAPPPGGAEDREPPSVLEMTPEPGAAGVRPDSAVTIVFSERPDQRSVMRALVVFPPVDFRESAWTENNLRLVPEEGWAEGRNTILRIGKDARDRRGNEMPTVFQSRFTTKDLPDSGVARGRVWPGKEITKTESILLAAYLTAPGDSADPTADPPAALTDAGKDGEFRLEGLDVGATYEVVGFSDRDGDARPSPERENSGRPPGVVVFAESTVVTVPDFLVGTLDSLGSVSGETLADSGQIAVVTARSRGEQIAASEVVAGGGAFSLSLPTGESYAVGAFLDLDGDSLRAAEEPGIDLEEPVSLELTASVSGIRFDLQGLAHEPPEPDTSSAAEGGETP